MTITTYEEKWDLDVFFEGGSHSPEFAVFLEGLHTQLEDFNELVEAFSISTTVDNKASLVEVINCFQSTFKKLRQAGAFVSCLTAQDTTDKRASLLQGKITQLSAALTSVLTALDQKLIKIDQDVWTGLLSEEPFSELSYILEERRKRAKEKLSLEQENLINSLSVDGYHAWGQQYNTIVGKIKVPFEDNGETQYLSVGQAFNKFSSSDRQVRKAMFEQWEKAWEDHTDYIGATLNHLGGFRLGVYKARGWENVLDEPLDINRMTKQTLDTMWAVITEHKAPFVEYLNRKAKLLGQDKLSWYDLDAPIGKTESKVTYQEGAEFIVEQFSKFGPKLTAFTKKAFEDSWIEAEDRPGKRPGGFCTSFPESNQSRIFMTFSGTPSNVSTLAHELGHAFHQEAMAGVHTLNRSYAMNVAETASTFAEMIVADASVKNAKNEDERIALLEDKIQRSVAFYMNIHARFIFETSFYEERKQGIVSSERLNELMLKAQQEAYCGALDEYHPQFWASKMHFYITGVPFYNFPYTFGYLFSMGIYAKALEEGTDYEEKYIALLKDTASMTVEDLAAKHLGVDLTQRDFWEKAVKLSIKDVEEFLEATK
ncbi:M3 family oligoendopeptidase [Fredinandcohnia quinoae]|uniref:M3 family oligoendopeptidase n=1 Tax=Fredinandcohnia quinoae TaxID=2918902 RepID=A0AAW5ECF4_9BACI|nr:M3 family oligoendopeptidase [Fredinandcohnia sp. SECRCQ15]MCH1627370.1 M3 family oligoendopeptidase [Fredinandcohnia sp. SECRCQ15]